MLNAIINMSGRTKPQFFGIFPTAHINDCFEQTSIWAVSGSHRSTAQPLILMVPKQMHHLCFHHQFSCSKNLIFLHMCRYIQKFLRAVVDRWYTIPNTNRSRDWIHFRYFENAAVSGPFIFVPFLSIACAKKCCNNSI